MAVSNEQLASYLASNPNLSDAQIAAAMTEYGVTPAQLASVTGISEGDVVSRIAKTLTPGQNINLGGVWVQPVYDSTGQGETFEQGQLREVLVYNQNQQTGDAYKQYSPTGEYIKSGQFKDVGNFGDLLKDAYKALGPIPMMALTAGGAGGLLGGSLGLTGTAANVAGGALLGGGNAALTGGNVLKGAVLGGASGYLQGSMPGANVETDASFLANDALQLRDQLGNNFAAIEQNLIASGIDPLVAATVSQQLAFNPSLTQADLATSLTNTFGNKIYDVNMTATTPLAATTNTTGLTNTQISNLIKAGVGLLGTGAAVNVVGGGANTLSQTPTQGTAGYTPDYYQQLQQYYNSYLPQTPRDVVSPLQQWYSQTYSGGNMQQPQQPAGTVTGTMQAAPVAPVSSVAPVVPATLGGLFTTGGGGSAVSRGPYEVSLPSGTTMALDPKTAIGNTVTTNGVVRPYSPVSGTLFTNAERQAQAQAELDARQIARDALRQTNSEQSAFVANPSQPFIITEGSGQPRPDTTPAGFVAPIYNPAVLPPTNQPFVSPYAMALANPNTIPLLSGETQEQGAARIQALNDELLARRARRSGS